MSVRTPVTMPIRTSNPTAPPSTSRPPVTAHRLAELQARVAAADPTAVVEVTNAMTGGVLGTVPRCTPADVTAAAAHARRVQRE